MSSITKFHSRAELGLRRPKSVSNTISPGRGGVAVHYGGAAQRISSPDEARARWIAWQRYHMDTRGWVDIAYTAGFDDWGNVYAGRGFGVRTAANGTNDGNNRYYAFTWIGGEGETPSAKALEALNWLIDEARREGGAGLDVRPHSSFKSTACPGQPLRDRARELDGERTLPGADGAAPTPTPSPTPAPAPKPSSSTITVDSKGSEVRSWQQDLLKWRPGILPRFGADGHFGGETRAATITFMRAAGLIGRTATPDRPVVGPKTRDAMKKALAGKASRPTFRFRYTSLLRSGSTGPAVDEWQRAVRAWDSKLIPGYTTQRGGPGTFGPQTVTATRVFQQRNGLTVDGIVGPKTRAKMTSVLNGR